MYGERWSSLRPNMNFGGKNYSEQTIRKDR